MTMLSLFLVFLFVIVTAVVVNWGFLVLVNRDMQHKCDVMALGRRSRSCSTSTCSRTPMARRWPIQSERPAGRRAGGRRPIASKTTMRGRPRYGPIGKT